MLRLSFSWQMKLLVAQLCRTLCDTMDCSLPGSSVHEILQARILEWVAIPFFRGSSWPRDWTRVSHAAGRFVAVWASFMLIAFPLWLVRLDFTLSQLLAQQGVPADDAHF